MNALLGRPAMSVRELGEVLGRLPVSLYYHLRALEKVGLVVRAGTRRAARGREALYRAAARELRIQPARRGRAEVAAMRRIGAGFFRRAQRLHDARVAEEPARSRLDREHMLAQRTVRLDGAGLRRVNRLLLELLDAVGESPDGAAEGAFYTLTLHLARNPSRLGARPADRR